MMGIFVIDGAVIVVLVVLGLRERIIDSIPYDLKLAIGIGIGAFITVVGLKNAGFVVSGGELGTLGHLGTWKMLVFVVVLLLTWTQYQRGVRGALLIGIVGATVLATVINALDHNKIWTDGTARLPQGAWLTSPKSGPGRRLPCLVPFRCPGWWGYRHHSRRGHVGPVRQRGHFDQRRPQRRNAR
jgi:xanthine/uracil/vitamin C permease (AzgA family)